LFFFKFGCEKWAEVRRRPLSGRWKKRAVEKVHKRKANRANLVDM